MARAAPIDRPARPGRNRFRRAWFFTTALAVVLLVVAAIVFTLSTGTRRITEHAQVLHVADQTVRYATAGRAQLGLAVSLAVIDERYGSDLFETIGVDGIGEASVALDQVDSGLAQLASSDVTTNETLRTETASFTATGREILSALDEGRVDDAQRIAEGNLSESYVALASTLEDEQANQLAELENADALQTRLGDFARFLLALVIPLAIIAIYREVVRRQQRQAELEVRLDAERQLSKARDDFVANASHELRTPLTSIFGLGQLLEEDDSLSETAREMVALINSETADLNRMVDDLLTTARLAAGQLRFEPEHVATTEEAEVIISPFQRSGTDIQVNVSPATVNADRLRQRQILRNLLSNARKYGGPTISLTGKPEGDWYVWTVEDDGPGVPAELQGRLFQRFIHQLSFQQAVAGGVGLGLAIVKSLAEGMGGSVGYERADDKTRFQVKLPLVGPTRLVRGGGAGSVDGRRLAAFQPFPDEGAA